MNNAKNNNDNRIFSGLFWKFCERVLAQLISFIVSVILARMLLPEEYGIVSIVLIFITFADVFVSSGFSTALIQKKNADETDFSSLFYCSLVVSIIIYIILFVLSPLIADFYNMPILCSALRVFALRIPLSSYNSIQHAYVSRHMLFKRFFYSTLIGTLISGVAGIAMAYANYGVWALVAQYLINTVVDTIILSFTVSWHPKKIFSWHSTKLLMNYGWKVLAADFSGTFFDQLRSLIVGKYYTSADLAYYNRGKQFSSLITDNISSSIMAVLFPALSNYADDKEKVKIIVRKGIRVMTYVIFPLSFGCAITAPSLVNVLLTEKWLSSIPFIQILCISGAIGLIGTVSLQSIKAIGRSDTLLRLEFIKKPVYVIMLVIGLKINVLAVAYTMLLYTLYSTLVNSYILKKYLNYSFLEQIRDVQTAAILSTIMCFMAGIFNYININAFYCLILQIIAGVTIYLGISVLANIEAFVYINNLLKNKLLKREV